MVLVHITKLSMVCWCYRIPPSPGGMPENTNSRFRCMKLSVSSSKHATSSSSSDIDDSPSSRCAISIFSILYSPFSTRFIQVFLHRRVVCDSLSSMARTCAYSVGPLSPPRCRRHLSVSVCEKSGPVGTLIGEVPMYQITVRAAPMERRGPRATALATAVYCTDGRAGAWLRQQWRDGRNDGGYCGGCRLTVCSSAALRAGSGVTCLPRVCVSPSRLLLPTAECRLSVE